MKKQTLKRVLATAMAAALSVSVMAGCNNKPATTSSATGTESKTESKAESKNPVVLEENGIKLNEPGKFPIVAEGQAPVEFTVFTSYHIDQCQLLDSKDNKTTKWLEDKLNVHFTWDITSGTDRTTKLNLMFSDGSYPDIIMNTWWDSATQYHYGEQGMLKPLNQYFENDAVFYHKLMEEAGDLIPQQAKDALTMPDGNVYALGDYKTAAYIKNTNRFWIYEPWLEKVNMKMPTTTDEFYNVLKAFKEKDPNGNGRADEIPMTGSLKGWNCNPFTFMMNSFTYYSTGNKRTVVDNGTVKMSYMQDEYKDGLAYLNKLESEGLLLEETWTQDLNGLKALTMADTPIVGTVAGGYIPSFANVTTNTEDSWAKWKAVAPLKGPKGVQWAETSTNYPAAMYLITDHCKNPRIAFRVADAMYDNDIGMTLKYGLQDEYWRYAEKGEIGINGEQAKFVVLKSYRENANDLNYCWSIVGVLAEHPGWLEGKRVNGSVETDQDAVTLIATNDYIPCAAKPDMLLPNLLFDENDATAVKDLETALNAAADAAYVDIITHGDVENKWAAFQQELKDLGVDDLIALYQKAYDAKMKK